MESILKRFKLVNVNMSWSSFNADHNAESLNRKKTLMVGEIPVYLQGPALSNGAHIIKYVWGNYGDWSHALRQPGSSSTYSCSRIPQSHKQGKCNNVWLG